MGIELTDDDLRTICADAIGRMHDAGVLYEKLLIEVRRRVPDLSAETIATVKKAIETRTWQDDGRRVTQTAFCCALYQLMAHRCAECLALLAGGRADAEVMRNLCATLPGMFGMLGGMAAFLNGEPQTADAALADMQAAYHALQRETGKAPSERAVADRSGYDRGTVRKRWLQLLNPTKTNR